MGTQENQQHTTINWPSEDTCHTINQMAQGINEHVARVAGEGGASQDSGGGSIYFSMLSTDNITENMQFN